MKVLFLTNIPSPYRADFFNELGKKCSLTVTYEGKKSTERDDKWVGSVAKSYDAIFLKGWRTHTEQFFCLEIVKILKQKWDVIIIGNYSTPTSILAIEYMKLHRIPYIIQVDGGLIKPNENKCRYILKKHFISSAEMWMSSGDETTKYLVYYGANRERCFKYPFASFWQSDLIKAKEFRRMDKQEIRKKLGMFESHIVLTVGRFSHEAWYIKGYDLIMKASEKLKEDIGIYIVGDEPTEEFVKWKEEKNLKNVHFIGFNEKQELLEYYAAADLFVLMTRSDVWGLVINEAMAFGLPIITTNMCVAGLELVENEKNGYIIPIENAEYLSEIIDKLVYNKHLLNEYGNESLKKIQQYTLENMAEVQINILKRYNEWRKLDV